MTNRQVSEFANRLVHALNNLEYPKSFGWKFLFIPLGKHYFIFRYANKNLKFIYIRKMIDFTHYAIHLSPHGINVTLAGFSRKNVYCRMHRVVKSYYFIYNVHVTVCYFWLNLYTSLSIKFS